MSVIYVSNAGNRVGILGEVGNGVGRVGNYVRDVGNDFGVGNYVDNNVSMLKMSFVIVLAVLMMILVRAFL